MAPESDRKWCEATHVQPIIASHLSLHPFWAIYFMLAILGPRNNHSPHAHSAPTVVIHPFAVFPTLLGQQLHNLIIPINVCYYSEVCNVDVNVERECTILPSKVIYDT
jgi:hypothetical protein